jgi:hypothetical protein
MAPLDEWSACRRNFHLTKHNTHNSHALTTGIGTHKPSKRAAADPRLRPRCHWDRHAEFVVAKTFRGREVGPYWAENVPTCSSIYCSRCNDLCFAPTFIQLLSNVLCTRNTTDISVAQDHLECDSDYQPFLSLACAERDSELAPFCKNLGRYSFVYIVLIGCLFKYLLSI